MHETAADLLLTRIDLYHFLGSHAGEKVEAGALNNKYCRDMDWELYIAAYVVGWTVDRSDSGEFPEGCGSGPGELAGLACRLLGEGYDSPSLRLAAGENWKSPDITELFERALHEIGLLPVLSTDAALTLFREVAARIVDRRMDELSGILHFWTILRSAQTLRKQAPFDEISKTEDSMRDYWPYHEEKNRLLVYKYAEAILDTHGRRVRSNSPEQGDGGTA